jgi:hypothetical protein
VLLEHLRDEAERALGDDVTAVIGGRDPRGLLSTMLQRVERKEGEARDVVLRTVDPEHPALVSRSVALVEEWLACHGRASVAAAAGDPGGVTWRTPGKGPALRASLIP